MVSELSWHRTSEIPEAVDVGDIQNIGPVEKVERLDASFALDALRERNHTLQAHIDIVEGITPVGVARARSYTVWKGKPIAIRIKSRIDTEKACALQAGQDGEFEVARNNRPLIRGLRKKCQGETMAHIVVAYRFVKLRVQIVFRGIAQVDCRRNVDGFRVRVIGQKIKVVGEGLSHAEGTGVVERKTHRPHVEYEAEARISRPARGRRPDIGWQGGTKSCGGRITKIFLAARQSRAICFHVSGAVAVDAGIHRQAAGMHPLIPQRNVEVLAHLVLDFETGLLGQGLVELLLGIAEGDLNQIAGKGIGAGTNEVLDGLSEKRKPRKADARRYRIVRRACTHRTRRPEADQVLTGMLELAQKWLSHGSELGSSHPTHQNVTVDKRSVE